MLKAFYKKYAFYFKQPGGTSRGILTSKDSWFIVIYDDQYLEFKGIGECGIIKGLSIDDRPDFELKLQQVCNEIDNWQFFLEEGLFDYPSIRFGLEMAIKDIAEDSSRILFRSEFTDGKASIPINGLVWMGDFDTMRSRIIEKIELGFSCIKLKVGAIDFNDEIKLLGLIRKEFSDKDIELRLDANGAFNPDQALEKLKKLSEFNIHSIEQPIKQKQWIKMGELCIKSPIPIALDEELIGLYNGEEINNMLDTIAPQYIILKPGLIGGWSQSSVFIREAENRNIGWWVTSALEGNVGLNAIAQWTYTLGNEMPQGLGTGQLFTNNFSSPLEIKKASLFFNQKYDWNLNEILDG